MAPRPGLSRHGALALVALLLSCSTPEAAIERLPARIGVGLQSAARGSASGTNAVDDPSVVRLLEEDEGRGVSVFGLRAGRAELRFDPNDGDTSVRQLDVVEIAGARARLVHDARPPFLVGLSYRFEVEYLDEAGLPLGGGSGNLVTTYPGFERLDPQHDLADRFLLTVRGVGAVAIQADGHPLGLAIPEVVTVDELEVALTFDEAPQSTYVRLTLTHRETGEDVPIHAEQYVTTLDEEPFTGPLPGSGLVCAVFAGTRHCVRYNGRGR